MTLKIDLVLCNVVFFLVQTGLIIYTSLNLKSLPATKWHILMFKTPSTLDISAGIFHVHQRSSRKITNLYSGNLFTINIKYLSGYEIHLYVYKIYKKFSTTKAICTSSFSSH